MGSSRAGFHGRSSRPNKRIPHSIQLALQHIRIRLHRQVGPLGQRNAALPAHRNHGTRAGRGGHHHRLFAGRICTDRSAQPADTGRGFFIIDQRGPCRSQSIPAAEGCAFAGRSTRRRSAGSSLTGIHANALVKNDARFGDGGQSR